MAILKDIAVTVVVNDQELTEYEDVGNTDDHADEAESLNTITRYIEAAAGANFKLKFDTNGPSFTGYNGLLFGVFVDGREVDNVVLYAQKTAVLRGARTLEMGLWTIRKFKFARLQLADASYGPPSLPDSHRLENLGLITIKVERVNATASSRSLSRSTRTTEELSSQSPLSEKALKGRAVTHRTSFDQPERIATVKPLNCDYLDSLKHPYASFSFKYRSRKALQAELIIPRTPSPIPLEDRPQETLNREELLELLNRRPVLVKPEAKAENSVRAGVKRERDPEYDEILSSAHVRKVARTQKEAEVIDLLDD
ncbi:hypothetical protein MMC30_001561 [Trapelia coarctata]|nr:hypothetical protein [Trapelia coarctata]